MKRFTKILSLLVLMIMSSAGAWADDYVAKVVWDNTETYYSTFNEALDYANQHGSNDKFVEIDLLKDCETKSDDYSDIIANKCIKISGGEHTLTLKNRVYVHGTLTIVDGTFKAQWDATNRSGMFDIYGGMNVNGGTFDASGVKADVFYFYESPSLTITDGSFKGGCMYNGHSHSVLKIYEGDNVTITGGTFAAGSSQDHSIYCSEYLSNALPDGYCFFEQVDGRWKVLHFGSSDYGTQKTVKVGLEYVAMIGETRYSTFTDAFTAATAATSTKDSPVRIDLADDCTVDGLTVPADKHIAISGGPCTMTFSDKVDVTGDLTIVDGTYTLNKEVDVTGNLTVNGGTLDASGSTGHAIVAMTNGTVTVNGGTIKGSSETDGCYGLYADDGTATLNGGTFSGKAGGLHSSKPVHTLLGSKMFFYNENGTDFYTGDWSLNEIAQTFTVKGNDEYGVAVRYYFSTDGPYQIQRCEDFSSALSFIYNTSYVTSTSDNPVKVFLLNDQSTGSTSLGQYTDIYGGNYTVTCTGAISFGGHVTIQSGTFKAASSLSDDYLFNVNGGDGAQLIIKDGTIDASGATANGIHVTNELSNVNATVYGGTIIGGPGKYGIYVRNKTNCATATLYGGTFSGGAGGLGSYYGPVSNFLATGKSYYLQESEDLYLMLKDMNGTEINKTFRVADTDQSKEAKVGDTEYDTFAEALTAAIDQSSSYINITITLLRNCVVDGFTAPANKNITITAGDYTMYLTNSVAVRGDLYINDGTFKALSSFTSNTLFDVSGTLHVTSGTLDASAVAADCIATCYGTFTSGCADITGGTIKGGSEHYGLREGAYDTSKRLSCGTFSGGAGALYLRNTVTEEVLGSYILYTDDNTIYTGDLNSNIVTAKNIIIGKPKAVTITSGTNGYTPFFVIYNFEFSGAKAYKASEPVEGTVTLSDVTGIIPANTGVIFKTDAAGEIITITPSLNKATADMTGNKLVAVKTGDTSWATGTNYVLMSKDTETKFFQVGGTLNVSQFAGKCYLNVPSSSVKSLSISMEDETGIASVDNVQPTTRGTKIIENGRIVIMKNGRKYNVAGQMMK